jgi:hypothetical protein
VAVLTALLAYRHAKQPVESAAQISRPNASTLAAAHSRVLHSARTAAADSGEASIDDDLLEMAAEADRLRAMARYPSSSQPLKLIGDPIEAAEHDAPRIEVPGPQGEMPVLTVFSEHPSFDAPEPMLIRAFLSDEKQSLTASIGATVLDAAARPVAELQFTAEESVDRSGTQQHRYVATFMPPVAAAPSTGYLIQVHARCADGQQREAQLTLQYNQPYARLTGEFRERFESGNLIIAAQVEVQQPATFRVDGSLYAQANQHPLAWASATAALPAGVQWLELTYSGLILRELGIDAPYVLRFVRLNTQTPDAESSSRALENSYVTQAYAASAFSGEPVNDPERLAEAAELRERVRRLASAE